MEPKDNSEFAWLVYCDWLDDNDEPGADELRSELSDSQSNQWHYEYRFGGVGGGVGGVGSVGVGGVGVGGVSGGVGGIGS